MTEPDEALLWARENRVTRLEPTPYCNEVPHIRLGVYDQQLLAEAHAYRAGAAASEARIEALKEALRAWVEKECDFMRRNNLGNPEVQPHVIWSRALLKEPRND
jgi:hypothetical protein